MLRQLVSKVQDVDLISPLAHIAEEAFNGVRGLNVSVHGLASTRKMSRGVLRPPSGLALLRDSARHTWLEKRPIG